MDADTVDDMKTFMRRPGVRHELAKTFELEPKSVTEAHALMVESALFLLNLEEAYSRPGWTVIATDVWGMPWGYRDPSRSHGTWAAHDVCSTVQKITMARPECCVCPPEPESRTHRSKAGQPQYLYLVRHQGLLKFGHGDTNRVRAHLRIGCELISLLRGPFEEVVKAELAIKRAHRDVLIDPRQWTMPVTFGAGNEVVTEEVDIRLSDYLSGPGVRDVAAKFA